MEIPSDNRQRLKVPFGKYSKKIAGVIYAEQKRSIQHLVNTDVLTSLKAINLQAGDVAAKVPSGS